MARFFSLSVVALAALLVTGATAEAGCHKRHCKATASCGDCGGDAVGVDSCGDDCGSACGTKTVYHNEYVTEKRTVNVVEHVKEERTRTVKVSVPTWVEEERQVTVHKMVPVTKTVTVKKPVWVEEEVQVTKKKMVPVTKTVTVKKAVWSTEAVEKTRTECRRVPVTETKLVTVCGGHWEDQMVEVACGGSSDSGCGRKHCGLFHKHRRHCGGCCEPAADACGGCEETATTLVCKKVWVPSTEQREVSCTHYVTEKVEVPYTVHVKKCDWVEEQKDVTVHECQDVTETVKVKKCTYVDESKDVTVHECQPVTETRKVKVCKHEVQEKTETYTVSVPHTVQKEIEVQVCRRVAVEVADCGGCDSDCGAVVSSCGSCN